MESNCNAYFGLLNALGAKANESLLSAAKRERNRRGPQMRAARVILQSGAGTDAQWSAIREAWDIAKSCPWPTPEAADPHEEE